MNLIISHLCRICLSDCKKLPSVNIFTKKLHDYNILLYDVIGELTSIKIEKKDGLPVQVCVKCEFKINEFMQLKLQTVKSHQTLLAERKKLKNDFQIETVGYDAIEQFENEQIITTEVLNESEHFIVEEINELDDETLDDEEDEEQNGEEQKVFVKSIKTLKKSGKHSENDTQNDDSSNVDEDDAVSFLSQIIFKSPQDLKVRQKLYENRRHECEVCKKKFVKKSNLVDHLRLHANVRNFKCSYCNKTFVQSGNYKSHLRTHTLERPFECSICLKTYNQSSALKIHMRSHTNERNYLCPICSKGFTNSSDLGKHKRIHDSVRKFACTKCSKTFAQKNHLVKHMKTNHTVPVKTSK